MDAVKRRIQYGFFCVLLWVVILLPGCGLAGGSDMIFGELTEASENVYAGAGETAAAGENSVEEEDSQAETVMADVYPQVSFIPEDESKEDCDGIWVHVCGAVVNPGVYRLSYGGRIQDAVEAAGGVLPEAAGDYLNLARRVSDGDKIIVPFLSEVGEAPYGDSLLQDRTSEEMAAQGNGTDQEAENDGLVNINTADVNVLMTLPGIGQGRAEDIVSYREAHGAFSEKEDLMQVSGIGEAIYEKLEYLITV